MNHKAEEIISRFVWPGLPFCACQNIKPYLYVSHLALAHQFRQYYRYRSLELRSHQILANQMGP